MQGRLVVIALIAFVLALGLWWLLDAEDRRTGDGAAATDASPAVTTDRSLSASKTSPVLRGDDRPNAPVVLGAGTTDHAPLPPSPWSIRGGIRLVVRHESGDLVEKFDAAWLFASKGRRLLHLPGIPIPESLDFRAAQGFLPEKTASAEPARVLARATGQMLLSPPDDREPVGLLVSWRQAGRMQWTPRRVSGVRADQVLSMVVHEPVSLELRVEGPSGKPRANYRVNYKTAWFGQPGGTAMTDANGRVTISGLPPDAPIHFHAPHSLIGSHATPPVARWHMTSDGEVTLRAESDHGIRVQFEGASAQVRVEATAYIRGQPPRVRGRLRRTWVAAGEGLWLPRASSSQQVDLVFRSALGDRSATLTGVVPREKPYIARLAEGAILSGTVVGPSGKQVSGATVDVVSGLHRAQATTDADGHFHLGGLPHASYRVLAQGWVGDDRPAYRLLETAPRTGLAIELDTSTRPLLIRAELPKGSRTWRALAARVFVDDLPWRCLTHDQRMDDRVAELQLDHVPAEPAAVALSSYLSDGERGEQGPVEQEVAVSARATIVEVDVDVERDK